MITAFDRQYLFWWPVTVIQTQTFYFKISCVFFDITSLVPQDDVEMANFIK